MAAVARLSLILLLAAMPALAEWQEPEPLLDEAGLEEPDVALSL